MSECDPIFGTDALPVPEGLVQRTEIILSNGGYMQCHITTIPTKGTELRTWIAEHFPRMLVQITDPQVRYERADYCARCERSHDPAVVCADVLSVCVDCKDPIEHAPEWWYTERAGQAKSGPLHQDCASKRLPASEDRERGGSSL